MAVKTLTIGVADKLSEAVTADFSFATIIIPNKNSAQYETYIRGGTKYTSKKEGAGNLVAHGKETAAATPAIANPAEVEAPLRTAPVEIGDVPNDTDERLGAKCDNLKLALVV